MFPLTGMIFSMTAFHNSNNHYQHAHTGTSPAVNVVEDDKDYRIEVAVPGIVQGKISRLTWRMMYLTISSEKKESKEDKKQNYLRREFNYRVLKGSFQLPETIDQEQIKAQS